MEINVPGKIISAVLLVSTLLLTLFCSIKTVPAGQVGVTTTFGKVNDVVLEEGINLKNPVAAVTLFDARQKSHYAQNISLNSADQHTSHADISIQYRLIKDKAPHMLKNTGRPEDVIHTHMQPLLRSKIREIGKSVPTAEEFFRPDIQSRMQSDIFESLQPLSEKGIQITNVLIREVRLPKIITDAINRKKLAAQNAEKAKEELRKFEIDQARKEAQAEAEKKATIVAANAKLEASRIEAKATIVAAEAQAKAKQLQIDVVGEANYVKLKAMEYLPMMSNGNHMIIMDPNAVNPLPFMNLGGVK